MHLQAYSISDGVWRYNHSSKEEQSPLIMGNHRGITITSVLGKVLEHILIERVKHTLRGAQHKLQFGFTPKLSPAMAALICSEVLANNRYRAQDTYVATIDVQKAFDSVWHDSVLRKLFIRTTGDSTWTMLAKLMRNTRVCAYAPPP